MAGEPQPRRIDPPRQIGFEQPAVGGEFPAMIGADQSVGGAFFGFAHRITGMNADIAQRAQMAFGITGQQNRAGGGLESHIAAAFLDARLMIDGDPRAQKQPLALGGEYIGAIQQLRVGDNRTLSTEPLSNRGDAVRKVHFGVRRLSVLLRRQTEPAVGMRSKDLCLCSHPGRSP